MAAEIEVVGSLTRDEATERYNAWLPTCDWKPRPSLLWFWFASEGGTDSLEDWRAFLERAECRIHVRHGEQVTLPECAEVCHADLNDDGSTTLYILPKTSAHHEHRR